MRSSSSGARVADCTGPITGITEVRLRDYRSNHRYALLEERGETIQEVSESTDLEPVVPSGRFVQDVVL